ncbi:MAG TPA: hypothetical protein VKC66_20290 [Xanthobacteraceae bacterium]|nr:hypothetical protein [Xanthobacteraceae bacterium]
MDERFESYLMNIVIMLKSVDFAVWTGVFWFSLIQTALLGLILWRVW